MSKVTLKLVRIVRKGLFDQSLTADGYYKREKDRERILELEGLRLIALLPFPALPVVFYPPYFFFFSLFSFFLLLPLVLLLFASSSSSSFHSFHLGAGHIRSWKVVFTERSLPKIEGTTTE